MGQIETGGSRHRHGKCRPFGPGTRCEETPLQQCTSCLPASPAPEGRHNLGRGRTAPGPEREKSLPICNGGCRYQHFDVGPSGPEERCRDTLAHIPMSIGQMTVQSIFRRF